MCMRIGCTRNSSPLIFSVRNSKFNGGLRFEGMYIHRFSSSRRCWRADGWGKDEGGGFGVLWEGTRWVGTEVFDLGWGNVACGEAVGFVVEIVVVTLLVRYMMELCRYLREEIYARQIVCPKINMDA